MTAINYDMKFKPTYLYVKVHSLTGKLYFGKTTKTGKNFEAYLGSGKRWLSHIKYHGVDKVETIWFCLFTEKSLLVEFSIMFSALFNIEKSEDWLNLIPENGLDGGPPLSQSAKKRLSDNWLGELNPNFERQYSENERFELGKGMRGETHTLSTKTRISESTKGCSNHFYGKKHSEESKLKMSEKLSGKNSPNHGRKHNQDFCASISSRMTKEGNHRFNTGFKFDVESPDGELLIGKTTSELSELFGQRNWCSMFKNSKKRIVCNVKLIKVYK